MGLKKYKYCRKCYECSERYSRNRSSRDRSSSSNRSSERSWRLLRANRRRTPSPYRRHKSRTTTNGSHSPRIRYEKWDRDRGGGGGGGGGGAGGGSGGPWPSRDRERDRERERQARAHDRHQMHAHAAEPDASSLFPAPIRVTGHRDKVSQQIQTKLGDYHLAQTFIDDPSKSIGICAEPPSPAPCLPSRRESEFKKPAHAPQNGRVHHRPYYNKNDGPSSTGAVHRPPPLRIPNGFPAQNAIDSSQPPIESILKEMKSLPVPLSVIAATPRKELENKFIFNPYTNKVQENPQLNSNDLKSPLPKPGLDNRISNSRRSVSPDVANKDLGLSESDDEVAATGHRLGPPLSPIGSGSPSSGSSSQSDSESESSSAESTAPPPPTSAASTPAPAILTASAPAQRSSWSLVNFAPPPAQPQDQTYDSGKELRHALADVKGKPSPISELSDSETSSPSPGSVRRRSTANRTSTASSDEDTPAHDTPSNRSASAAQKRGRPPKTRTSEERPAKKKRGRPPKSRHDDAPPELPEPPPHAPQPTLPLQDSKTHIFRKVFTPRKGDEGGGKGGKGGKGKGGKGKGQVTIIEGTAHEPRADEEERRRPSPRVERPAPPAAARHHEHKLLAEPNVSDKVMDRLADTKVSIERLSDAKSIDRLNESKMSIDRLTDSKMSMDRLSDNKMSIDRLTESKISIDRLNDSKMSMDRLTDNKMSIDRLSDNKMAIDRLTDGKMSMDRLSDDKLSIDRLQNSKLGVDRLTDNKMSVDRLTDSKVPIDRLNDSKIPIDRLTDSKIPMVDRYVRAEADVGSGLKTGRGSERLEEATSIAAAPRRRGRILVRVPLARLQPDVVRGLRRPPPNHHNQNVEVAATNHERSGGCAGQTPIYYSYFERLPADALSDEERDHKYYLEEARRLRGAAEREQEPLACVMLYLESVLCFVLTGRVLELELDTKGAFNVYRQTIEYIKVIHSMPQRYRASPHDTFNKLDILSLRVQALLYLRMFKMYNREVKEYNKIVHEYQQKPACVESVSPLSPSPSPASVGSVGSASSGYCSLVHSVPAHAHQALLLLTKYYAFLYVAHDLWEQADALCRLPVNQDLFIAVDRKCGPLSLSSTFRHLVQYVRYAITLLKSAPRE